MFMFFGRNNILLALLLHVIFPSSGSASLLQSDDQRNPQYHGQSGGRTDLLLPESTTIVHAPSLSATLKLFPDQTQDPGLAFRHESKNGERGSDRLEVKDRLNIIGIGARGDEDVTSEIKDMDHPLPLIKYRRLLSHERLDLARKAEGEGIASGVTEDARVKTPSPEAPVVDFEQNSLMRKREFSMRIYLAQYSEVDVEKTELIAIFTGLALVIMMISCLISCIHRNRKNKEYDDDEADDKLVVNFEQKFTKIHFIDCPALVYGDETEQSSW